MSQPGYPNALPAARVAQRLREATGTEFHQFVPDDISLLDLRRFDSGQLLAHRQVTNAHLLALTVTNGLRFVTFDGGVALRVALGADARQIELL